MKPEMFGLTVNGIVMAKNSFPSDKGERLSLDIAVPGQKAMISVGVDRKKYDSVPLMTQHECKVNFSLFKGNVYFNDVSKVA